MAEFWDGPVRRRAGGVVLEPLVGERKLVDGGGEFQSGKIQCRGEKGEDFQIQSETNPEKFQQNDQGNQKTKKKSELN